MKLQTINCFCDDESGSGNPAAVVSQFSGNDDEKQKFATYLNLPVTVFISDLDTLEPTLDFFYPGAQMPLCLHGTLGSAKFLFDLSGSRIQTFKTRSGQRLEVVHSADFVQVKTGVEIPPPIHWSTNEVQMLLGIQKDDLDENLPYTIASIGSPKLLVPLKSPEFLKKMTPNYDQITQWSVTHIVNGMYVYARADKQNSFFARGFNPKTGHKEDAATGVAAAALASCLKQDLIIRQGQCIGKPSRICVTFKHESEIWVGGRVEVLS